MPYDQPPHEARGCQTMERTPSMPQLTALAAEIHGSYPSDCDPLTARAHLLEQYPALKRVLNDTPRDWHYDLPRLLDWHITIAIAFGASIHRLHQVYDNLADLKVELTLAKERANVQEGRAESSESDLHLCREALRKCQLNADCDRTTLKREIASLKELLEVESQKHEQVLRDSERWRDDAQRTEDARSALQRSLVDKGQEITSIRSRCRLWQLVACMSPVLFIIVGLVVASLIVA